MALHEPFPSLIVQPQGRLTLATGVPVMVTTQSAKTTIYYTPHVGRFVPLYTGSTLAMFDIGGELSQATTDSTKSPAAVGNNANYDVFAWDDAGTKRATRGPSWSSDTARGTGAGTTELEMVNGILVNKVAITNGPAARFGTYLGTVRSNGSAQIDYILGGSAAGGTAGLIGVWNCYNRRPVIHFVRDTTDSWTYNGTFRSADNSAGMRVSFIRGLDEDGVVAKYTCYCLNSASSAGHVGVALDSTTTNHGTGDESPVSASAAISADYASSAPGLGWHFLQATESTAGAAVNVTFYGDNTNQPSYGNGMIVQAWA